MRCSAEGPRHLRVPGTALLARPQRPARGLPVRGQVGVTMTKIVTPDKLHRLLKLALDKGEVSTLEEAELLFAGYRLGIEVGADAATSPTLQAAVLTAVNAGRRGFLGGVSVAGAVDVPLRVPLRGCRTLAEAVSNLQGSVVAAL